MPVMDGYALTRALRDAGDRAPIIGVTADTSEEASQQMRDAGMNDMLFKPCSLDALSQTLGRWLPTQEEQLASEAPRQARVQLPGISWLTLFGDEAVARSMASEIPGSQRAGWRGHEAGAGQPGYPGAGGDGTSHQGAAHGGTAGIGRGGGPAGGGGQMKQLDKLDDLARAVQALMDSIRGETGFMAR